MFTSLAYLIIHGTRVHDRLDISEHQEERMAHWACQASAW